MQNTGGICFCYYRVKTERRWGDRQTSTVQIGCWHNVLCTLQWNEVSFNHLSRWLLVKNVHESGEMHALAKAGVRTENKRWNKRSNKILSHQHKGYLPQIFSILIAFADDNFESLCVAESSSCCSLRDVLTYRKRKRVHEMRSHFFLQTAFSSFGEEFFSQVLLLHRAKNAKNNFLPKLLFEISPPF